MADDRMGEKIVGKQEREITLRVVVVDPPAGVVWRMQRGRHELVDPVSAAEGRLVFDAAVRVGGDRPDGGPNLLGPFAHGRPDDRFLYVNSGTSAGQHPSPWSRRAKVKLAGIDWGLVERAESDPDTVLEVRFAGTLRDGSPACATVPLLDGGWRAVRGGATRAGTARKAG
ncbi:MAG TPA: DUF5990 family protein [Longimicrobium sp.]|nr:DUF5990 family protein [Longimicrobium sp.]